LRLPDASSSENEANRAFVAASKLRLGPEVFEITPNLTVMAKVPGHSGSYMLPSSITESKSERVVAAFVERLARFHRAGWIHGDVHFDNVVFDPKAGTLKLINFDNSRTQRDLLTSKETQRLFRVDVDRAYRDVVALLKPDGVTELAWFQDFKRLYLQALAGGADEASHKSTVHKARFDLAASKLRDLEASIESGPFLLPKLVRLRGDK
jgi:serine/threonine protein kinase